MSGEQKKKRSARFYRVEFDVSYLHNSAFF